MWEAVCLNYGAALIAWVRPYYLRDHLPLPLFSISFLIFLLPSRFCLFCKLVVPYQHRQYLFPPTIFPFLVGAAMTVFTNLLPTVWCVGAPSAWQVCQSLYSPTQKFFKSQESPSTTQPGVKMRNYVYLVASGKKTVPLNYRGAEIDTYSKSLTPNTAVGSGSERLKNFWTKLYQQLALDLHIIHGWSVMLMSSIILKLRLCCSTELMNEQRR